MELKFRAWTGKLMINRGLCDRNWYDDDNKCVTGAMPDDKNNLAIMQFTGLTDKNGKDVFEGDLLQNESGRIGKVVWHKYCACWDAEVVYAPRSSDFHGFINRDWKYHVEVIGNCHQHPELMDRGNNND